jgi:recombination associated protein RdgC
MAIFSGGIRFRRYEVSGKLPADLRNAFEGRIRAQAFSPFAPNDPRDEAVGWVAADDWFDTDLYPDRWLYGNMITLSIRTDVRRVPSLILKHECKKTQAEWKERLGRERLTRAEREDIKSINTKRLAEGVLPSIRGVDMFWDLERAEILFFSSGEKANDAFVTIFEKTFELSLMPIFPYSLAIRALGEDRAAAADAAVAASFMAGRGA